MANQPDTKTILRMAQGTSEDKALILGYLAQMTQGNIHVISSLINDPDTRIANEAISWLEQIETLAHNRGK